MNKAIRIHATGDESVLKWEDAPLAAELEGENILISHKAIGINFIDIYHRAGLYPVELPAILGMEAAGVVQDAGENKMGFQVGDRVAYCTSIGSYTQERLIAAEHLIRLPADIGYEQAAAMMLKGMTAEYLIRRVFDVQKGDAVLFHAIAGGVGFDCLAVAKAARSLRYRNRQHGRKGAAGSEIWL